MLKNSYKLSRQQTPEFVQNMRNKFSKHSFYLPFRRILQCLEEFYNPHTYLPFIQHSFNSSELAIQNGKSDWFVLSLFIKNFGNLLYLFNQPDIGLSINNPSSIIPQTFITGCAFPKQIIYPEFNPSNDFSPNGIYKPHCGLKNTLVSYNNNEFLYQVLNNPLNKNLLPPEALYCIRYSDLYLHHQYNAYEYLLDDYDKAMMPLLKEFVEYDLDGKSMKIYNINDYKKYELLWKLFFQNYGLYL